MEYTDRHGNRRAIQEFNVRIWCALLEKAEKMVSHRVPTDQEFHMCEF
jgi:hypothetical protein